MIICSLILHVKKTSVSITKLKKKWSPFTQLLVMQNNTYQSTAIICKLSLKKLLTNAPLLSTLLSWMKIKPFLVLALWTEQQLEQKCATTPQQNVHSHVSSMAATTASIYLYLCMLPILNFESMLQFWLHLLYQGLTPFCTYLNAIQHFSYASM